MRKRIRLEQVSVFKYLGCVLNESGTYEEEYSRKLTSGRMIVCVIRSLVNARSLQFECAMVLYESLLVPVLTYDYETMIWRKKETSRISAVHMDILRGLLGIRRMDKVPNARIKQLFGVTKGMDENIDESFLRWLGHVEIMENERIAKKFYVECADSHSVSRPRKR